MDKGLDSWMKCLCCDRTVVVNSKKWAEFEMPIVTCPPCAKTVPTATVKVLFIMRSQIATLGNEMVLVKKNITQLFKAQQELEQDLLEDVG